MTYRKWSIKHRYSIKRRTFDKYNLISATVEYARLFDYLQWVH